jgi:hypothetical protein
MARYLVRASIMVALVGSLVWGASGMASATSIYKSAGRDPDEATVKHGDIQTTTRSVWQSASGRRYLTVAFWEYKGQEVGGAFGETFYLDTRGGGRPDYGIGVGEDEGGNAGCGLYSTTTHHRWHGDLIKGPWGCRVLMSHMVVSKRIRWRLHVESLDYANHSDDAPDAGFYR